MQDIKHVVRGALGASSLGEDRLNALSLHIVYVKERNLEMSTCATLSCIYYPINILRNIAMNYVMTPWILSLDIDMIPSDQHTLNRAMDAAMAQEALDLNQNLELKRAWILVVRKTKCSTFFRSD